MNNTLKVQQLTIKTGNTFDFQASDEEITFVTGPSGSGKTLLLRAIADLDEHKGEVYFNDSASSSMSATTWRTKVSLLLSDSAWWYPNVLDHFIPVADRNNEAQLTVLIDWIEQVKLPKSCLKRAVADLSTGELNRLALLRALFRNPEVLLLDEPTANLDDQTTLAVESFLLKQIAKRKLVTIWVSHSKEQVQRLGGKNINLPYNQKNFEEGIKDHD
jgi:ABC-type iron transport system FetAB ATPase subunit